MNTIWMLTARHEGRPIIPVDEVCRDYFTHLTPQKFLRKVTDGTLPLPLVRIEDSQKSAKGVAILDLASYLDQRIEAGKREFSQLYG